MSDEARDYVVIAVKYSTQGQALFWRDGGSGYTWNLDEAGRYTRAEALSCERTRGDDFDDIAVPLAVAEAASKRRVSDDDAHGWRRQRRSGKEASARTPSGATRGDGEG